MPVTIIPPLRPCLRATDLRSLGNGVKVGETRTPGDVKDADEIIATRMYIVHGTPADGTIRYNGNDVSIGRSVIGVAGQTSFTRSANTVRLIKTKTSTQAGIPTDGLTASDYIVAGDPTDLIEYPDTSGRQYAPGQMFRGAPGVSYRKIDDDVRVFEIDDNPAITTALAVHHIGSVTFPNTLDYSQSLGFDASQGVAVKGTNLAVIVLWNFGTAAATVRLQAYSSDIERSSGAIRSDETIELPSGGLPYLFWPSYPFLQAGLGGITGDEDAVAAKQNAFVFQTNSRNIWVLPLLHTSAGFQ